MAEFSAQEFTKRVRPIALANRGYSKIFGIGANKTGTTSLEAILRLYGFNLPNEMEQKMRLSKQTCLGNYEPFTNFVSQYDAFQDQPFSRDSVYIVADCLFPNSKFILTERDPEAWWESMCRYTGKNAGVGDIRLLTSEQRKAHFQSSYPAWAQESLERRVLSFEEGRPVLRWDLIADRDFGIERYMRRNEEIRGYFHSRPDSLLRIDLTQEKSTARICTFLGIPDEFAIRTPHLNRTR
jgi:hypothetical protein